LNNDQLRDTITSLLNLTSDQTIINSIPTSLLLSLNINLKNIPASNLPRAFLKEYSRNLLSSSPLSNITDIDTLSKVLPGINKNDLLQIPDNNKINVLVNLLNASSINQIALTSSQVIINISVEDLSSLYFMVF